MSEKPDIRDDDRIKEPSKPKPPIEPKGEPLPSYFGKSIITKIYLPY